MKTTIENHSAEVETAVEVMYQLETIDNDAKNLINANSDVVVPIDDGLRDYIESARIKLEAARCGYSVQTDPRSEGVQ